VRERREDHGMISGRKNIAEEIRRVEAELKRELIRLCGMCQ
jgi:hypothetical protein